MQTVKTIGERIATMRKGKGWKRPELGRRMAQAVGRAKPYSGEQVRRYETGMDRPPPEARKALATVFEKSEQFIEFGATAQVRRATSDDPDHARNAREGILLHLYRGLFSLQQERLIASLRALFDANQITRKELGQKPLVGVGDDQVRRAFGDAPFHRMQRRKLSSPPRRDPGTALDDFLEE